jgi:hypothetical protein
MAEGSFSIICITTCFLVSGPRDVAVTGRRAAANIYNFSTKIDIIKQCVCCAVEVCAWPRAPWFHPAPSRTWSCPMAAPESTARATAWEARPLRADPSRLDHILHADARSGIILSVVTTAGWSSGSSLGS